MEWRTIESDPAVFTELTERLGVKTPLEVAEVIDVDDLSPSDGCKGLILLFRYDKDRMAPAGSAGGGSSGDPSVFFCKQTVEDACGTIALLHVLMNADGVELGDVLTEFKSFASAVPDPTMVGDALGSASDICEAHNHFARPKLFHSAPRDKGGEEGDAFHFVAYVPKNGALYELDGLQPEPIRLCAVDEAPPATPGASDAAASSSSSSSGGGSGWLAAARRAVRERISRYASSGELRFTLLSVRASLLAAARQRLGQASARLSVTQGVLTQGGGAVARAASLGSVSPSRITGAGWSPASTPSALEADRDALNEEVAALRAEFDTLTAERDKGRRENARRRHNWLPFSVALLTEAARAGRLDAMVAKGGERHRELVRQHVQRRAAAAAAAAKTA